jgi:hypothetical protein
MINHLSIPHTGVSASAGMGQMNHGHSQQMAFAANRRLQMARAMSGQPAQPGPMSGMMGAPPPQQAPQGDFRQHVAQAAGVPAGPQEVHGAIQKLTQAGQFTPLQGHALMAHQGPLQGPQGAATVQKIAGVVRQGRMAPRPPMAPQAPMAPGMRQ